MRLVGKFPVEIACAELIEHPTQQRVFFLQTRDALFAFCVCEAVRVIHDPMPPTNFMP